MQNATNAKRNNQKSPLMNREAISQLCAFRFLFYIVMVWEKSK